MMGLQAVEMEMVEICRVVMGLVAMEVADQEDLVDFMVEEPEDQVGGPGGPWNQPQNLPHWLQGLLHQQETVRTMDLPSLQELSESEIGPLIAGDWLRNIGPYTRDLSALSAGWWDLVLRTI